MRATYADWVAPKSWTVTRTVGGPPLGVKLLFFGLGDGGSDSVVRVEGTGSVYGTSCKYHPNDDSVTVTVAQNGASASVTVRRAVAASSEWLEATIAGPASLRAKSPHVPQPSGGSWTAEEGSGSRHWHHRKEELRYEDGARSICDAVPEGTESARV